MKSKGDIYKDGWTEIVPINPKAIKMPNKPPKMKSKKKEKYKVGKLNKGFSVFEQVLWDREKESKRDKKEELWEDEYVELYGYLDKYSKGIIQRQGKWFAKIISQELAKERERVIKRLEKLQIDINDPNLPHTPEINFIFNRLLKIINLIKGGK